MTDHHEQRFALLVVVNRLFEWSQNFVTRELVELERQGVTVYVGARTVIERDDLNSQEARLKNSFIQIPENPFVPSSLLKHVGYFLNHPIPYLHAWKHFLTFGHSNIKKYGRSLVCLFRAVAIAEMILKKRIQLLHAHFMTAPTETGFYISVLTNIPFGCTAHAMDIYQDNSGITKKLHHAAYVITVTDANVRHFKKHWEDDAVKVHRIYTSVSHSSNCFSPRKPHVPFEFLAVGRLVSKKGFKYLIQACHILKTENLSFHCRIIGTGPLEQKLQELVSSLELSNFVCFEGYVAPNKMQPIYKNSDALVMPSIIEDNGDRDGLPTVCIEALSYGLPLVCTNVSGLPESVLESQNGKIVPQKDPKALARAMQEIITSSDYASMSAASQKLGLEKFNIEKNVGRLKSIMKKHYKP